MNTVSLPARANLPPDELTARLHQLRADERHLLVEFLTYLAEVDRRRLYLELGFSSLFVFLTDFLGLSSSSAYRRSTAARLLARFPVIADYLDDGRLRLTTLVELRDVLEEDRLDEVLGRAAGRTEDQVKDLVAALRPRPAPADLLRRLSQAKPGTPPPVNTSGPAAEPPRPRPVARIEPISEELRVLRVTVGRAFVEDLTAVKAALSHQIPDGNLEKVLHQCIRVTLEKCAKQRRGSGKPDSGRKETRRSSRYVPASVRDEVWRRDQGRCTFVGTTGRRCNETHQLELHHRVPHAKGGPPTADNLTLACKRHNAHQAEKDFGAEHVAQAVASARKKAASRQSSFW